jgi:hypothetical protein
MFVFLASKQKLIKNSSSSEDQPKTKLHGPTLTGANFAFTSEF